MNIDANKTTPVLMPAGFYAIGDLCHYFEDKFFQKLIKDTGNDNPFPDGIWFHETAYGDGMFEITGPTVDTDDCLQVRNDFAGICVDSGTIGLAAIKPWTFPSNLMVYFNAKEPFEVWYEQGALAFANYIIDTDVGIGAALKDVASMAAPT